MNEWIFISISIIAILVIIVIALVLIYQKKNKEETINRNIDYKVFFSLGFVWIPICIVFMIGLVSEQISQMRYDSTPLQSN